MIAEQESTYFYYERNNKQGNMVLCVDNKNPKKYPLTYTIEECLEDYCSERGWDFDHIQIGSSIHQEGGNGRFYYNSQVEGNCGVKQVPFTWSTEPTGCRILVDDCLSTYFPLAETIEECLQRFCGRRGWSYVSVDVTDMTSSGYLRYRV